MSEKLQIEIEGLGADKLKKQLIDIGREGTRVAQEIKKEFRKSLELKGSLGTSTDIGREAKIAMNSFRMAERERARINKEVEREISQNRRSAAEEAKRSAREVAAVQSAAAQSAKAHRLAAIEAERAAAAQAVAAARQQASAQRAASAEQRRFVSEERNRATGLRRAQRAEQQAAAREATAARRRQAADARDARQGEQTGGRLSGLVLGAVGVFGVRQLAADFAMLSDSMENARNRMRIVTGSEQQMTQVMGELKSVALDTRTEFDLTTRTYARMSQATAQLKLGQNANIEMTETLNKAISVSGATGAEAHATLIQLSQAMASNRLSADEFRSVSEQLPIILDLLSDSTGKARTELKKMGEDGKLTAAVISLAVLEGQEKIDKMFKKTMPTIEQAWTNVGTQARFALDQFNKATGASSAVVSALQYMATNMDTVTFAIKTMAFMVGGVLIAQVGRAAIALRALAMANPWTALLVGATTVFSTMRQYREEILDTLGIQQELVLQRDDHATFGYSLSMKNRADRVVYDKDGRAIKYGTPEEREKRARYDENIRKGRQMLRDEAQAEVRQQLIQRLRAQAAKDAQNAKKGKKGPPTFEEAIGDLEGDVAALTMEKDTRQSLVAIMNIQDKIQRKLTQNESDYVDQLVRSKTEMEAHEEMLKTRAEMEQQMVREREERMRKADQERAEEVRRQTQEKNEVFNQASRRYMTARAGGSLPSDAAEIDMMRGMMDSDVRAGRLSQNASRRLSERLEMGDARTSDTRKRFLEETHGMGQMKQDLEGIFGTEGMMVKGFAAATASSIVFKDSFKKSISELGKSIQAEIIQTLIQGLIRMSILSIMGGGKGVPVPGTGALPAVKTGSASGGYTGDMPRSQIAGYHHGGEFVINATATKNNRALLEHINSGRNSGTMGGNVKVTVINQRAETDVEVRQGASPGEVYVIAKRAVQEHAQREVAAAMNDANSAFMKNLNRTTSARFQR